MTALQPFAARPNLKRCVRAETHAQGDEGTGDEGQNRPQPRARPPRRLAAQHPCQHPQGKARARKLQDARAGPHCTEPVRFTQLLAACVESFHGRAAFARARMDPAVAAEFDAQVRAIIAPYCHDGETVELQLVTEVVRGTPLTLSGSPTSKSSRDC